MKLAAEGLFAQNLKKNLPHFSKAVGIITSSTGAALQDILHILARRDPSLKVVIYPTAVQGKEATAEIVQMIELANARQEVDVLIVGRGGGSLEDLWCFNEEEVARAIFSFNLTHYQCGGTRNRCDDCRFCCRSSCADPFCCG